MLILSNISRLYDGSSADAAAIKHNVDVGLDGSHIAFVRPHQPAADPGAPRVDGSGWTVTPGLVDCHGHITILGLADTDTQRMEGQAQLLFVEKILHTTLVDGGVTTMRDIGGATDFMKRMVEEGVMIGPRLKIAICMLSSTGGHADFRGPDRCHGEVAKMWGPAPGRPSMVVDGPWACRKRVREIAACGADLIKVCTSPGVASPGDQLEHQDFSPEEIEAICTEARARGLKVAAHAHSQSGIGLAIDNGVYDIQHISFMDERLVDRAYQAGCTVTPTSWIIQELVHAEGLSPFIMEKVKKVAEVHARSVEYARKGGLKILAGTDPVLPRMHGRNYMEMVALIADGLSPLQAWYGMTGLAAAEIGQDDSGTIAAGKRADLLICKGDVIDDPALLDEAALLEVIKDGEGYRGALETLPQRDYQRVARDLWATSEAS